MALAEGKLVLANTHLRRFQVSVTSFLRTEKQLQRHEYISGADTVVVAR